MRKKSVAIIMLTLIVTMAYGVITVFGSTESRDLLYGDGAVETLEAFNNFTMIAGLGELTWDNSGASGSLHSIKGSVTRATTKDPGEEFIAQYSFHTPAGFQSAGVSFWYKLLTSNDGNGMTANVFTVKILDPVTRNVIWTSNGVYNLAAPLTTWTQYKSNSTDPSAGIAGLVADKDYLLQVSCSCKPNIGQWIYAYLDQIVLTVKWNDVVGPSFVRITPDENRYCQTEAAPLKVIVSDASGTKTVALSQQAQLYVDGTPTPATATPIGNITQSTLRGTQTFDFNWDTSQLKTGLYKVTFQATDGSLSANTATTSRIYKVDNEGPVVSQANPATASVLTGYDQVLSASVADWSKVGEVTWEYWDELDQEWVWIGTDKEPDTGDETNGVYSIIWHTTNVKDGTYTLRIIAKDKAPISNDNDPGYPTYTYQVDNLKPKLQSILPTERGFISGNSTLSVEVPAAYDGNGIKEVRWYYTDPATKTWQLIGQDTTATVDVFSVNWDTTQVIDGTYELKIEAENLLGSVGTAQFRYTVDNTAPVLVSASASSKNLVTLLFTELNITSSTSTDPNNYKLFETSNTTRQLTVNVIEPKADGSGLKLTTSDQTPGVQYTAQIVGTISDNAGNQLQGQTSVEFYGNGQVKGNPHGGYQDNSGWCAVCHVTHAGEGVTLLSQSKQKLVCYICHDDSGLSYYDVRKEFGSVEAEGAATTHHPIPEDEQECTTCHTPHEDYGDANPMLLRVTDGNDNSYETGNDVCWACHGNETTHGSTVVALTNIPGVDDHQSFYTTAPGLNGGPQSAHADTSKALLQPPTYSGINCGICHEPHGSENPKLLRLQVNNTVVYGNSDDFCMACHQNILGSFLGKAVWENTTYSAHSRTDSGAMYPGGNYAPSRSETDRGKCINCHNLHGTPYGYSLVERFTVPSYNDADAYTNYAMCFKCHGPDGVSKGVTSKDMTGYYAETFAGEDSFGGTMGHFIKSTNRYTDGKGNYLAAGWKIPCIDCHNTHGSTGENRFLLKGNIDSESPALTHLFKGTVKSARQFCIQCHRVSDDARGVGTAYRNGRIPLLPANNPQHFAAGTVECNYCHGGGNLIKGAHAPNDGRSEGNLDCNLCHTVMADEMNIASTRARHQMTHFEADLDNKYDASHIGTLESKTCLSTCHTDHEVFNGDPPGEKRYLRATGGDTTVTPSGISANYQVETNSYLNRDVAKVTGLCMTSVCHGTNGSLDDINYASPSGFAGTSNLYSQIRSTMSTHAISSDPLNPTYVSQTTLTSTFWADWSKRVPKRLVCTDCHMDTTTGATFDQMRQGPHSSNNLYMLKATGNVNGSIQTYDSLCNLCHNKSTYGGNGVVGSGTGSKTSVTHTKTGHYGPSTNPSGCLGCHAGNREGFGATGATKGSVHGTNSEAHFLNGNYIEDADTAVKSCTMDTTDPTGAKCKFKHKSAETY